MWWLVPCIRDTGGGWPIHGLSPIPLPTTCPTCFCCQWHQLHPKIQPNVTVIISHSSVLLVAGLPSPLLTPSACPLCPLEFGWSPLPGSCGPLLTDHNFISSVKSEPWAPHAHTAMASGCSLPNHTQQILQRPSPSWCIPVSNSPGFPLQPSSSAAHMCRSSRPEYKSQARAQSRMPVEAAEHNSTPSALKPHLIRQLFCKMRAGVLIYREPVHGNTRFPLASPSLILSLIFPLLGILLNFS